MSKLFDYPEGYHDFTDGVPISNSQIVGWIDHCLHRLREKFSKQPGLKEYHHDIASGNTRVSVSAYKNTHSDLYMIYVFVDTSRRQAVDYDVDLSKPGF